MAKQAIVRSVVEIPEGMQLVKEYKHVRAQLLMRPTTKNAVRRIAQKNGISFNEMVHRILDEYVESHTVHI